MIIGIPKELKNNENRVAITPAGVIAFRNAGHKVIVEKNAGIKSGISNDDFERAGAIIASGNKEIYQKAEMVLKVKEPLPEEYNLLRPNQILFTYLHLAPDKKLTEELLKRKVTAIAYETVQMEDGSLPLLKPMSEVAGRMSIQIGARLLERMNGGRGVLLGGVPGVPPAQVVIIGAGTAGLNAAKMAAGLGAEVTILDINIKKLAYIDDIFNGRIVTLMSNTYNIANACKKADLVISAVLIPGAMAPSIIKEYMVKDMKKGSVVMDFAIDQGGSVETMDKMTTHDKPTFIKHGVIHYSVPNIAGAVPRTSTFALTNATIPYALTIANKGFTKAIIEEEHLARGVNTYEGKVTHPGVGKALNLDFANLDELRMMVKY